MESSSDHRKHNDRDAAAVSDPLANTSSSGAGWSARTSSRFKHRLSPAHRGIGPKERAILEGAFHLDLVSLTPVHIINQVPLFSELKVVNQDGNTVGSHEVIWISRKTLVLPGFGVTVRSHGRTVWQAQLHGLQELEAMGPTHH